MTKQVYFEMCEQMGSSPIDSEIPVELEDLVEEAQTAFKIYTMLQDNWDMMNGTYLGKVYTNISTIFEIYAIPKSIQRDIYELIVHIDSLRATEINSKKKPSK